MSDFLQACERMIVNEGGYVLHTVKNDRGGQTYAGIARNAWPKWAFLSCLCGSERALPGFWRAGAFLSCLCGSELL